MDIIAGLIIFTSVLMNIEIPLFACMYNKDAKELIKYFYFDYKDHPFYVVWIINLLAIASIIYLVCIHS